MAEHDWDMHYAQGELPWDTGEPAEELVAFVNEGSVAPGRALDIGCGTGTNALWLAQRGFDVVGVDIAPRAIERARAKSAQSQVTCRFEVLDFLSADPPGGPFQFVFDRGCLHVFDDCVVQQRFAARVAALLAPAGYWLSFLGSTEGPARESGPPRRSARDITTAIEPSLELVWLRSATLPGPYGGPALKAWLCLSRAREIAAQPSTR